MKIKHKVTIYNKKYPYGFEKICISEGEPVEKPSYLSSSSDCIYLKNDKGIIYMIETDSIIKIYD